MTAPEDTAFAELRDAVATLRRDLAAARARRRTDETAALQRQALSGALGPEMQTLGERVRSGATTWGEVFDGTSPDVDLARAHVTRMAEVHCPRLRGQVR